MTVKIVCEVQYIVVKKAKCKFNFSQQYVDTEKVAYKLHIM